MSLKEKIAALKQKHVEVNKPIATVAAPAPEEKPKPPKQTKPPTPPSPKKPWKPKVRVCSVCGEKSAKHRLPVDSSLALNFDGNKWTGTLMVPGFEMFHAENIGQFALCKALDHLWQDAAFPPGKRPYEFQKSVDMTEAVG